MAREKNPYVNHSIEDVEAAELNSYIIQIGTELFNEGPYEAFPKHKADQFHDAILRGFRDIFRHGTEQEKKDVMNVISNFRIVPLRIQ